MGKGKSPPITDIVQVKVESSSMITQLSEVIGRIEQKLQILEPDKVKERIRECVSKISDLQSQIENELDGIKEQLNKLVGEEERWK
jgi:predicted DNA-binding protein YlxM (UPF0122 family)